MKTSLVEKTGYVENGEKNGDIIEIYFCYYIRINLQLATQKPFRESLQGTSFFKEKLQLHHRHSVKKVFLNVSQNSQERTCAGVSLYLETFFKSDSSDVVF